MKDNVKPTGHFKLKIYEDDKLIETFEKSNLVVDTGRTTLTKLIAADGSYSSKKVDRVYFGTNGTDPTVADTTSTMTKIVTAPVSVTVTTTYPTSKSVKFSWTLDYAESNGEAIREYGLIFDYGSLDILYARVVRDVVNKTVSIKLDGEWTLTYS